MNKNQIAKDLETYILEKDISKAEFARRIGASPRTVGRCLEGNMSDEIAVKIMTVITDSENLSVEQVSSKKRGRKKKGSKVAIGIRPEARAFVDAYKRIKNISTDTDAITGIVLEWGELMLKNGIGIGNTLI